MSKILRLGFVMGGGVSLGTFSGSALSEAIKQLIVHGQYKSDEKDENGQPVYKPYDKIEIDVFSGSSAGAISLGIMLRVLVNHRDKFKILGYSSYAEFRKYLENKVMEQFGEPVYKMKYENPEKFEGLVAAQAVQEFQEKIWAKGVDIHRLLGTGVHEKDLSHIAGLVDRDVVDDLARNYFQFQSFSGRLNNRVLLADRVLFGCTLANLNFTLKKEHLQKDNQQEGPYLQALNDISTELVHSELRVFDLNFGEINPATTRYYPLKWIQYHDGNPLIADQEDGYGNSYNKEIKNLSNNDAWREMTATAIASSAFPFAFDPVVLNRYRYEFGQDWPEELAEKEKYTFTYMDGGTFNNEPIREGMRLAAYIDNIQNTVDFDRMVIFVDPMVNNLETQFRVDVHDSIGTSRNLLSGKSKIAQKSTLMRLVSKVPHVITAILNEAQTIELSKVSSVIQQFDNRKKMRAFYKANKQAPNNDQAVIDLRNFVIEELDEIRSAMYLPPNTMQIQHELIRILKEEADFFDGHLPLEDRMEMIDAIQQFVYAPKPTELEKIDYWMVALSCVALDVAMKLSGKTSNARIIPIASFNFYDPEQQYELMPLPGAGIAGFAGFASNAASDYEVQYGRYCAYRILKDMRLTAGHENDPPMPPPFNYNNFNGPIKDALNRSILKRIKEIIPNEYSSVLPFMEGIIQRGIESFIEDNINVNASSRSFEFRIQVPSDIFQLRGFKENGMVSKKRSLDPARFEDGLFLVTQLTYFPKEKKWRGEHLNELQKLFVDKMRLFENTAVLGIELPVLEPGHEAFQSAHPIFTLDARAQLSVGGYTEVKALGWKLWTDIRPLDEHLWGEDKWQKLEKKM